MIRLILLLCSITTTLMAFGQKEVESKKTVNTYKNGAKMREQIKYAGSDTIIELTYYENGQLNQKTQLVKG